MRKLWTEDEIAYLREHYPTEGLKICKHLGRSACSVVNMAYKLQLHKPNIDYEETEISNTFIDETAPVHFNSVEDAMEYNRQVIKGRSFRNKVKTRGTKNPLVDKIRWV